MEGRMTSIFINIYPKMARLVADANNNLKLDNQLDLWHFLFYFILYNLIDFILTR